MGLKYCKLRDKTQRKLLEYVVLEVTARATADPLELQANTTALLYRKIRLIMTAKLESAASEMAGEIELDESYYDGVRKGKRGRGAAGKVPVFGILKTRRESIDPDDCEHAHGDAHVHHSPYNRAG